MTRITRRKQVQPKRMKYGENGKQLTITPQTAEETGNEQDENEADNEDEADDDSENESCSSTTIRDDDDNAIDTKAIDDAVDRNDKVIASALVNVQTSPSLPKMTVKKELVPTEILSLNTPGSSSAEAVKAKCQLWLDIKRDIIDNDTGLVKNDIERWNNGPLNGVTKTAESEIMDLSAKRRRSFSDDDDSEPAVKVPKTELVKVDFTQPLDLSQKSSRPNTHAPDHERRGQSLMPITTQPTPMSPSLASLQKKFGGHITTPKTPVDVARSAISKPHSGVPVSRESAQPVTSRSGFWYSNVYRQTMAPYSAMFAHSKLPYYPGISDIPLHASFPSLAAAATGILEPTMSLGNQKLSKLPTNHHHHHSASRTVAMTTSKTSITQSPHKHHKQQLPKTVTGTPPLHQTLTSPMTSPRAVVNGPLPGLNFELTDAKTNCIDFKCDCGKAYSTLYELSVHMQDTGHMPRNTKAGPSGDYPKLVRGQDMWLNNGLEQTKQILRCMHCGESFKTLPELTVHMMKTQHYADIFSSAHRKLHKCTTFFEKENDTKSVFKCRVCETEYDSLDSLANHMVESRHHRRSSGSNRASSMSLDDPIKIRQTLLASMATVATHDDCDSRSDETPPYDSPANRKLVDGSRAAKLENHHDSLPHDNNRLRSHNMQSRSRDFPDADDVLSSADTKSHRRATRKSPSAITQNGDVNHNTESRKLGDVNKLDIETSLKVCPSDVIEKSSEVTSRPDSAATSEQDDSPMSDIEDEGEHNIKCENCFERIKTELFVEHVRHCISRERKSTAATSKPLLTSVVSTTSPLENHTTPPEKKQGSALKAMEQFIENFTERKTPRTAQVPMSSLLYDYVGPLGNGPHAKSELPGDELDHGTSPLDAASKAMRVPMYYNRSGSGVEHSALHNLYRFASFGNKNSNHTLTRHPDSPSGRPLSRSPPSSPKRSSSDKSPHSDDVTALTKDSDAIGHMRDARAASATLNHVRGDDAKNDREPTSTSPSLRHVVSRTSPLHVIIPTQELRPRDGPSPHSKRSQEDSRSRGQDAKSPYDVTTPRGSPPKQSMSPPSAAKRLSTTSPGEFRRNSDTDHDKKSTSALDSLKGLVDKQMDKSEHPLNSLQKLINQTDGNHSNSVASLQSRLINVTSSPYWFSFSHLTRGWQGSTGAKSESPTSDRGEESVVDSDGVEVRLADLKCDQCSKLFSSRGGCRYHRSKCTVNVAKNMATKEAHIVQTPYTYLPLEHTNKFSKYYEMARELANKSQ